MRSRYVAGRRLQPSQKGALMRYPRLAILTMLALTPVMAGAQSDQPTNDAPNPYNTVSNYFKLPEGRTWGSTSAVDIDKDGRSIWVAERCGTNSCLDRATGKMSDLPTVLKFDASGKLVKSFGAGLLIFPHGIYVDKAGKFIKEWGKLGPGPGEFDQPHALAFDSRGRLFVGDSNNNRVQVFDQDGKFIEEFRQFSRPSGIFIKNDILYVADSESESV